MIEFMAGFMVALFIVTLVFLLSPGERIGGDPLREAREREVACKKFERHVLGRDLEEGGIE